MYIANGNLVLEKDSSALCRTRVICCLAKDAWKTRSAFRVRAGTTTHRIGSSHSLCVAHPAQRKTEQLYRGPGNGARGKATDSGPVQHPFHSFCRRKGNGGQATWPRGSNRIGKCAGPWTCNALRGSHGSSLASSKLFVRSSKSPRAMRASIRESAAPRQEWMP